MLAYGNSKRTLRFSFRGEVVTPPAQDGRQMDLTKSGKQSKQGDCSSFYLF